MAEIKFKPDYGYAPGSPLWLIWGGNRFEAMEHISRESAEDEAAEIALAHPGEPVHVLAVVATVQTSPEIVGQRFDPQRTPKPPEFAEVESPAAPQPVE